MKVLHDPPSAKWPLTIAVSAPTSIGRLACSVYADGGAGDAYVAVASSGGDAGLVKVKPRQQRQQNGSVASKHVSTKTKIPRTKDDLACVWLRPTAGLCEHRFRVYRCWGRA